MPATVTKEQSEGPGVRGEVLATIAEGIGHYLCLLKPHSLPVSSLISFSSETKKPRLRAVLCDLPKVTLCGSGQVETQPKSVQPQSPCSAHASMRRQRGQVGGTEAAATAREEGMKRWPPARTERHGGQDERAWLPGRP